MGEAPPGSAGPAIADSRQLAVRCEVCGREMTPGSGGKWLCRGCGYMITCCDP